MRRLTITAIAALVVLLAAPVASAYWTPYPVFLDQVRQVLGDFDPPPYPPGQEVPPEFGSPWDNEGQTIVTREGDVWVAERDERGTPVWKKKGKKVVVAGHNVWVLNADSTPAGLPEADPWVLYEGIDNYCAWLEYAANNGIDP